MFLVSANQIRDLAIDLYDAIIKDIKEKNQSVAKPEIDKTREENSNQN